MSDTWRGFTTNFIDRRTAHAVASQVRNLVRFDIEVFAENTDSAAFLVRDAISVVREYTSPDDEDWMTYRRLRWLRITNDARSTIKVFKDCVHEWDVEVGDVYVRHTSLIGALEILLRKL